MTTTQMEMCLNEASIVVLKDSMTATPQSNGFLNFGYQQAVDEFTGDFMLRAQTTNVEYLNIYLYDANRNSVYPVGYSGSPCKIGVPYRVESVVKYVTFYGHSLQQSQATATVFLVRNMLYESCFQRHSLFTDGRCYANVFVRELYISGDIFSMLSNPQLILLQAWNENHTYGPLITIADKNSYDSSQNIYTNRLYTHDCDLDVIALNGVGLFVGKTCYMVADWDNAWTLCENSNMVVNNEIVFDSKINQYTASHLKFSPTIAAYLNDNLSVISNV